MARFTRLWQAMRTHTTNSGNRSGDRKNDYSDKEGKSLPSELPKGPNKFANDLAKHSDGQGCRHQCPNCSAETPS